MSWGRLTNAQGKFLRQLMIHKGTIQEVAKEVGTPIHKVEAWLGQSVFRKALAGRMKAMDRLRELDVRRGAAESARRLSNAAFGLGDFTKKNLYERRACVDLIQLARAWARERYAARLMGARGEAALAEEGKVVEGAAMSEREWVRSMSGDEGVKAYDELKAMREARWARERAEREGRERGEAGASGAGGT